MSMLPGALGLLGKVAAIGGGALGAGMAAKSMVADPLLGAADEMLSGGERLSAAQRLQGRASDSLLEARLRVQRQQNNLQLNIGQLAQFRPDLLQELAAGQRLPRGAVVIGGQVRMDLVEQAGQQMGAYSPPPDPLSET